MKLRIISAQKTSRQSRLFEKLLSTVMDASLQNMTAPSWQHILQSDCDMLLLHRSLIPSPPLKHIARLKEKLWTASLVIIDDMDSQLDQTRFCAAGVDAVLSADTPEALLHETLLTLIEQRHQHLMASVASRRAVARPQLEDFVSRSAAMNQFMNTVEQILDNDVSLLILGETGVGKERLARAIHGAGPRSDGPFISVNCGAVPENLIESELFGHEKGAFTGAEKTRRGAFEQAHRGTIFLDEIGEMPKLLQVKLLHVLQDYEIKPLGADHSMPVDVRVIAATNRNLLHEIEQHTFRQDLYYRIGVITLTVPPLRERHEDISTLSRSFLNQLSKRLGKNTTVFTDEALDALVNYSWPGNVRELINVIERAVLLCRSNTITLSDLPPELTHFSPTTQSVQQAPATPWPQNWKELSLKQFRQQLIHHSEQEYLQYLLTETAGSITRTADKAGITTRALNEKMRKYNLHKETYKQHS